MDYSLLLAVGIFVVALLLLGYGSGWRRAAFTAVGVLAVIGTYVLAKDALGGEVIVVAVVALFFVALVLRLIRESGKS